MADLTLSTGFLQVLSDSIIRATLLLTVALITARAATRSSAALRHRIWTLVLCALIAIPLASCLVPRWRLPILPALAQVSKNETATENRPAEIVAAQVPVAEVSIDAGAQEIQTPATATIQQQSFDSVHANTYETSKPWSIADLFFVVWFLGFLAVSVPTLASLTANEVRRQRACRIVSNEWLSLLEATRRQFSIGRAVELRRDEASLIPQTWGIIRPVVLLPEASESWPDATRRLVLLHEMAHVRRFDVGSQLLGRIATALYWFHPLAWYGLHRLRTECEHACDDLVIETGERPTVYATELLNLARSLHNPRFSLAVAMSRKNTLEERLVALFDGRRNHRPVDRRTSLRILAVTLLLTIGLATIEPGRRTATADEPHAVPKVQADSAKQGLGKISGRVVLGKEGTPAEGAEVVLMVPPTDADTDGTYHAVRTQTNAKGEFSFNKLPAGRHQVWSNQGTLTSRKRRFQDKSINLKAGEAKSDVELKLVQGLTVKAVVKEKATGKPIPGAKLSMHWSDWKTAPVSDAEGRIRFQPHCAELCEFEVAADGFAKGSESVNLENGKDANVEFLLEPGGDLEGIVRDPAGRPLPKTGLSVFRVGGSRQVIYTKTGDDGHYRLGNLPRGVELEITVSKQDFGQKQVPAKVTGLKQALDLILEPRPDGGSITGMVVDHLGQPVSGASIRNMGNSSGDVRETKTGDDGRFRLDNLYESSSFGKEILVRAKGTAPKRLKVKTGTGGQTSYMTIKMEKGHRIKGQVVDDKDRPLNDVSVYFADGGNPFSDGDRGTTDETGHFDFDSLPNDCPFSFAKESYSEINHQKLTLDTDETIKVVMIPSGVLMGRVVDVATGKPIPSFNVEVTFSPKRKPGDPNGGLRGHLSKPGQNFDSDEAAFQIGDLINGMPLQVTVSAKGYEKTVAERVIATRADEAAVVEYRLEAIDPATLRTYSGRLTDTNGKPLAQAQLRLIAAYDRNQFQRQAFPFNIEMIESGQISQQPNVTRFLEATTDAEGRFEFNEVPKDDEAELVWWGKGVSRGRLDHLELLGDKEKQSIEAVSPIPGRIVGTLDRKEFPGEVQISIGNRYINAKEMIDEKDDKARFEINDLAPGRYQIQLMSPFERAPGEGPGMMTSHVLKTINVKVEAGKEHQIDFR